MRVLVTGGRGYLGRAIVTRLLARGESVRCLIRGGTLEGEDVAAAQVVHGDVTDAAAVRRALEGIEAVFHTAACVRTWLRDPSEFDRVNVASLGPLVESALAAGVRRVVYTSSFMALGPTDGRVADETTIHPGGRYRNDYERTKALGLAKARELARGGAPLITVIPGVIYGPGALTDGNHVAKIAGDFLARRLPGIPGRGDRRWTYSYIDDVAAGHLLALDRGRDGETYILGGDEIDLAGLLALLESLSGVSAPRLHVPINCLKILGAIEVGAAYVTGRAPQLTPGVAAIYDHEWRMSSEKARREIGYATTPLREGMGRLVSWLRAARSNGGVAGRAGDAAVARREGA